MKLTSRIDQFIRRLLTLMTVSIVFITFHSPPAIAYSMAAAEQIHLSSRKLEQSSGTSNATQKLAAGESTIRLGYGILPDDRIGPSAALLPRGSIDRASDRMHTNKRRDVRRAMRIIKATVVISMMLVLLCGITFRLYERKRTANALEELARKLVTSKEAERIRVAQELHDGISQLLVAAKYYFESASECCPVSRTDLLVLLKLGLKKIDESIREVRHVSCNLNSTLLDEFGLEAALERLGCELTERTAIQTKITTMEVGDKLSSTAKHGFLRIAQEALTNVEKHANASLVVLTLDEQNETFALTITDNGQGPSHIQHDSPLKNGQGLRNMRNRLVELGGTLSLRSTTGQTRVVAQIPYPAAARRKRNRAMVKNGLPT